MAEPLWLDRDLVLALHDATSSPPRAGRRAFATRVCLSPPLPLNRFAYEGVTDVIDLAATYAVAIASNHPFIDGNKRSAFMALGLFLDENGVRLVAGADDATQAMLAVARGEMTIEALAEWLRPNVAPA